MKKVIIPIIILAIAGIGVSFKKISKQKAIFVDKRTIE